MNIICKSVAIVLSMMSWSCNDKPEAESSVQTRASEGRVSKGTPISEHRVFVKDTKQALDFKVKVFDAEAKGLGSFYSKRSELKDAVLLADFSAVNNYSEESVIKNDDENYNLVSKVLLADTRVFAEVDIYLEFNGQTIQTKTLLKVGKYQLMEVNNPKDSERVYVYEFSLEEAK